MYIGWRWAANALDQFGGPLQDEVRCRAEGADCRVKRRRADHRTVPFIRVLLVPQSADAVSWKLSHSIVMVTLLLS